MNTRSSKNSFLPVSCAEMKQRGWKELDILLISGDAYVDHPSFGTAMIGRILEAAGYRVGVVAQPDWKNPHSVKALGRPRLFCGVTSGNLDSMLANYTAARRKRKDDAYTENGEYGKRPNRAVMVYSQLVKGAFKGVPVIIGGIEASLRRVVHYDYWQDKLRPSILAESKADLLVYGMGEKQILEAAGRLAAGNSDLSGIRGTAMLLGGKASEQLDLKRFRTLPSFDDCLKEKDALINLTKAVEEEQNPFCAKRLVQFHGKRALVIEPPVPPPAQEELDGYYNLPFQRLPHPKYQGEIPAFAMIRNSVTVVRGCPGGCSFCGLGLHQGKRLASRSSDSVEKEVDQLCSDPEFRGTINDLGGPTANVYGWSNIDSEACKMCRRPSCFYPNFCPNMIPDENAHLMLLSRVAEKSGVKHVYVSSGIRMDAALKTPKYIRELAKHYTPGHLKVAPEHLHPNVLRRMRKPAPNLFERFRKTFDEETKRAGKKQYLVPYFISNFPGCTQEEMKSVEQFLKKEGWQLQQVQDFIPLPMTAAAAMYYTGKDFESGESIHVVRGLAERRTQQKQLRGKRFSGKKNNLHVRKRKKRNNG